MASSREKKISSESDERLTPEGVNDLWHILSPDERADAVRALERTQAEDFFLSHPVRDQLQVVLALPHGERRGWLRLLAPDDVADLIQAAPPGYRDDLLKQLDDQTRTEVAALLAYAEDNAGGLMHARYARLRPDMKVDEAISYLKKQTREKIETLYYVYVLDAEQHLLGVVSLRELFLAAPGKPVRDVMRTDLVTVSDRMDQESVARVFAQHAFIAVPVVDAQGRMKGIVTVDDIVDVVHEEATEDAQKFGGMEALNEPYLQIGFGAMIKKRAGWLSALFIGEMLTASAMGHYEESVKKAVVLALFVPLIISSGGNTGSQASTLVIRAMALGEVRLQDWWRVIRRELAAGLILGAILACLGIARIVLWQLLFQPYGEHYVLVALTVGVSLVGVVLFGTLTGSMLPFLLRRAGFDPASASAPFVATLVDVTGLVIYFTAAFVLLRGALL